MSESSLIFGKLSHFSLNFEELIDHYLESAFRAKDFFLADLVEFASEEIWVYLEYGATSGEGKLAQLLQVAAIALDT